MHCGKSKTSVVSGNIVHQYVTKQHPQNGCHYDAHTKNSSHKQWLHHSLTLSINDFRWRWIIHISSYFCLSGPLSPSILPVPRSSFWSRLCPCLPSSIPSPLTLSHPSCTTDLPTPIPLSASWEITPCLNRIAYRRAHLCRWNNVLLIPVRCLWNVFKVKRAQHYRLANTVVLQKKC